MPEIPRPPRRPSQVDPEEIDDPFAHPSRMPALRDSRASFGEEPRTSPSRRDPQGPPGRYALMHPELEERLVHALKTLESVPPAQAQASAKLDSVHVELMKLQHQAQLDGQRRDLAMERLGERQALLEKRVDDLERGGSKTIETELERARASQTHWVRYVVTVVISLVTGAVLLGLGRLLR